MVSLAITCRFLTIVCGWILIFTRRVESVSVHKNCARLPLYSSSWSASWANTSSSVRPYPVGGLLTAPPDDSSQPVSMPS